jgi:uncharacterized membrane protein
MMKKYFLTGLILFLPVALTLWIIIFLFDFFTKPFVPIVTKLLEGLKPYFPFVEQEGLDQFLIKVCALVLLCIFIFLLGVFARWFLVRNLVRLLQAILSRIPILNAVFKISRDVFSALFAPDGKKMFRRPVMVPFAGHLNQCLGFEVGEAPPECEKRINGKLVSVFAPTAPHPISGFLFLVPEKDIFHLNLSNEEAVKYLVSCGLIVPERHGHS